MSPTPSLDVSILDSLRELQELGEPDIVTELVDVYLADAPRHCKGLRDAQLAADPDALARSAHSLKSSSGNLGALRLCELCGQLEALGIAGDIEAARPLVGELHEEYATLERLLKAQRVLV